MQNIDSIASKLACQAILEAAYRKGRRVQEFMASVRHAKGGTESLMVKAIDEEDAVRKLDKLYPGASLNSIGDCDAGSVQLHDLVQALDTAKSKA